MGALGAPTLRGAHFSGSYAPDDVCFLLKPIDMPLIDVAEKERLIQRGERHYSEMLSPEPLPSPAYLEVFRAALARNRRRFAADLVHLSDLIDEARPREITLVSLARAGTPVGVLLRRILRRRHGRDAPHFSISIIRDRGLDRNALRQILASGHAPESIVFVDGWTGKGVIGDELRRGVRAFNQEEGLSLPEGLHVVADLCGGAAGAATADDYLIPSGVLNATISGLVSRSILNDLYVREGDFHGCLYFPHLAPHDLSRAFVDEVMDEVRRAEDDGDRPLRASPPRAASGETTALFRRRHDALTDIAEEHHVLDRNHLKPGIGEATRVLLRRVPGLVLVRDPDAEDVAHVLLLARERGVRVEAAAALPFEAVAIIRQLGGRP
jgi:hypothetical protein